MFHYRRIRLVMFSIKAKHNIPYLSESVHSQLQSHFMFALLCHTLAES
jgi:hypothetical protein